MDLSDLLEVERISCQCNAQSKKRALQSLAELLGESLKAKATAESDAEASNDEDSGEAKASTRKSRRLRKQSDKGDEGPETPSVMQILDALIARERLGSTGLGHGVGLPHSRLHDIHEPIAAFVTLEKGVDYESADDKPVDLIFALLVPEDCNDEHLKILAQLARRFSDEGFRDSLRTFDNASALYDHLTSLPPTVEN